MHRVSPEDKSTSSRVGQNAVERKNIFERALFFFYSRLLIDFPEGTLIFRPRAHMPLNPHAAPAAADDQCCHVSAAVNGIDGTRRMNVNTLV